MSGRLVTCLVLLVPQKHAEHLNMPQHAGMLGFSWWPLECSDTEAEAKSHLTGVNELCTSDSNRVCKRAIGMNATACIGSCGPDKRLVQV